MYEQKHYQTDNFFEKVVRKKVSAKYLLYVPEEYHFDKNKKWPCIMFLHGGWEQGDDLNLVKKLGLPKIIDKKKDFPFIVISPQCPEGYNWSNIVLIFLLKEILKKYRIDRDRVYLTGVSMGGYAAWDLAIKYPDIFAAIAPVCAGGDPYLVPKMRNVPVWAFHGEHDEVVKLFKAKRMVNTLKKCGGNAKLTVFKDLAHEIWSETYNNPELYQWFLSHKKAK